jgi:outer membrane protein assembly factor BamB
MFSLLDKKALWSRPLNVNSNIASDGQKTVFVLHQRGLEAIEAKTGKTLGLKKDAAQFDAGLAFHDGRLYGFFSRKFFVLDAATGDVIFSSKLEVKESSAFSRPLFVSGFLLSGNDDSCDILRVSMK